MHWDFLRCIDTNAHLVAIDGQYRHFDVITDADGRCLRMRQRCPLQCYSADGRVMALHQMIIEISPVDTRHIEKLHCRYNIHAFDAVMNIHIASLC